MSLTKVTYTMIEGAPINVQDYGAVGDGFTNDTAAILLALNALTNNSSLVFPIGNYVISSSLSKTLSNLNNIKIIGLGATITYGIDQNIQTFRVNILPNVEIMNCLLNVVFI
jgi:polygalacturonase